MELKRVYSETRLSDLEHARLIHVLQVWQQKRKERRFPARADLTPRDLLPALSCVTLCRVVEDGDDFEVRLAGEEVRSAYGGDFRGKRLSHLAAEIGTSMLEAYRNVARRGEAVLLTGSFEHSKDKLMRREVLLMPLGRNESQVDHILGAGTLLPLLDAPPHKHVAVASAQTTTATENLSRSSVVSATLD
ncbi:MAG TPA: PAS domain-containing protein [Rhizomicrobium sp.]|nr:PAS domain-containing protein [Rhizomicrobium sp.]